MNDVNHCPLLVSSSDAYSDLWPAFFHILKREWPEHKGKIVLNTDKLDFSFPGLDITCSCVGKNGKVPFGTALKHSLGFIEGDVFIMMMIDYFLEGPIDVERLQRYFEAFRNDNVAAFFLAHQDNPSFPVMGFPDAEEMDIEHTEGFPVQTLFSFQTAFWRKSEIHKFIADWEDPWFAEYFGCQRAKILKPRFWKISKDVCLPIPYDRSGVLHEGGKWLMEALSKVNMTGVPIELKKSIKLRGVCSGSSHPYISRLPKELHLLPSRCISYIKSSAQLRALRTHASGATIP